MNNYLVYKHTSPSGKVYIGIICQRPEYRWREGKKYKNNEHFTAAIEKYGWSNFRHEIIAEGLTREEAVCMEVMLIAQHKSNDRAYGYNITPGGDHYHHTEESRRKISEAGKGRHHTEETRRKMSEARRGENSHFYGKAPGVKGKHLSESTKQKLREAHRGKKLSEEHRQKLSDAKKGKPAHNRKPVLCVETGTQYPSVAAAADAIGISFGCIAHVCRGDGRQKTAGGFHWQYIS